MIAGKSILAFKRDQEEEQELSARCFAWVQTYDESLSDVSLSCSRAKGCSKASR